MPGTGPLRLALLLALAVPATGCLAAAAGGAAAGIYLTSRGAEGVVEGAVDDVARRAEAVMNEMGIPVTGNKTEKSGDVREFVGKKGDLDVTVHLERETPTTTKAEVTARKNLAEWDKDYAKEVLSRIVAKG